MPRARTRSSRPNARTSPAMVGVNGGRRNRSNSERRCPSGTTRSLSSWARSPGRLLAPGGCEPDTYGGDLARGIVTAMANPQASNEDFNLSTAERCTVLELAGLIWCKIKGAGPQLRIVHDDPFAHDVQRRVPATDKAKQVLGFEATTTLEQMLDEVIPWIGQAIRAGII